MYDKVGASSPASSVPRVPLGKADSSLLLVPGVSPGTEVETGEAAAAEEEAGRSFSGGGGCNTTFFDSFRAVLRDAAFDEKMPRADSAASAPSLATIALGLRDEGFAVGTFDAGFVFNGKGLRRLDFGFDGDASSDGFSCTSRVGTVLGAESR